jgi:hypothetical protein
MAPVFSCIAPSVCSAGIKPIVFGMNGGILFAAPRRYEGDNAFYTKRDAFRFVQHLESTGVSAKMVLLPSATGDGVPRDKRLLVASYAQWISPEFWKGFGVRTVVVYAFGVIRPRRMPAVFRAIRDAGCRVVFQMGSAFGLPAFPYRAWTMFKRRYRWARGGGRSAVLSFVRAVLQELHWAWGGTFRFMCRDLLPLCDSIRVESKTALENTRKRLRSLHQAETADRVVLATHPVPDVYAWDGSRTAKKNRIVCVAVDWRNPRKGGRVLAKALARVLPGSGWDAVVVGKHSDAVADEAATAKHLVRPVLEEDASVLEPIYKEARIFFTASGAEEAPNVVQEALVSGCSVVFPPELVHLDSIVRAGAGTMSRHRTGRSLAEAIRREMDAWESDARDPDDIFLRVGQPSLASVLAPGLGPTAVARVTAVASDFRLC